MNIEMGLYKFVAIGREIRLFDSNESHDTHVTEEERPLVIGAGCVAVFEDYWKLYDNYSISLKIYSDPEIIPRLTRLLQRPYKDKSDYSAIQEEKEDDYRELLREGR